MQFGLAIVLIEFIGCRPFAAAEDKLPDFVKFELGGSRFAANGEVFVMTFFT